MYYYFMYDRMTFSLLLWLFVSSTLITPPHAHIGPPWLLMAFLLCIVQSYKTNLWVHLGHSIPSLCQDPSWCRWIFLPSSYWGHSVLPTCCLSLRQVLTKQLLFCSQERCWSVSCSNCRSGKRKAGQRLHFSFLRVHSAIAFCQTPWESCLFSLCPFLGHK